ncbi:MAG TPA: methyltransferase [Burkholderiaceae bacterium]
MSWSALITSVVLTLLLAAPFQWFLGAGRDTFVMRQPDAGALWGQLSFLSGMGALLWVGLFGGFALDAAMLGALALAAAAVVLYEWARRTVGRQRLHIGLSGRVPARLIEDGPYRWLRHPFYLAYMLAFGAVALALRSPVGGAVAVANIALFAGMALHDEASIARSALAGDYAGYRRRVGLLLLLPRRSRVPASEPGGARDA